MPFVKALLLIFILCACHKRMWMETEANKLKELSSLHLGIYVVDIIKCVHGKLKVINEISFCCFFWPILCLCTRTDPLSYVYTTWHELTDDGRGREHEILLRNIQKEVIINRLQLYLYRPHKKMRERHWHNEHFVCLTY